MREKAGSVREFRLASGIALVASLCVGLPVEASGPAPTPRDRYEQVIAGRADKIVATLTVASDEAAGQVRETLLDFYRSVNAWHEAHGARRKELARDAGEDAKAELAGLEAELAAIRTSFDRRVKELLPAGEVVKVKDGLTYGVVQVTERAYHDMLLELTPEQKARIHAWLDEARDLAISEGSSEAKHGVFGRFKGKINNYLSEQGYDLKQAERDWQARRKAAAESSAGTSKESQ